MADRFRNPNSRRGSTPGAVAVAVILLVVSAAGAADRMVLGEYFTNLH